MAHESDEGVLQQIPSTTNRGNDRLLADSTAIESPPERRAARRRTAPSRYLDDSCRVRRDEGRAVPNMTAAPIAGRLLTAPVDKASSPDCLDGRRCELQNVRWSPSHTTPMAGQAGDLVRAESTPAACPTSSMPPSRPAIAAMSRDVGDDPRPCRVRSRFRMYNALRANPSAQVHPREMTKKACFSALSCSTGEAKQAAARRQNELGLRRQHRPPAVMRSCRLAVTRPCGAPIPSERKPRLRHRQFTPPPPALARR